MTNKERSIPLVRLSLFLLFIFIFCLNVKLGGNERKRIDNSVIVLNELLNTPDKGIPGDIIEKSECIAVIPSVKKGAFIFGGQYGKGLVSCRNQNNGWTAPVFFALEAGSFGFQIGGQAIDLVLVIMNKKGVDHLLQDKFTLGADASVAAGPVG